MSHFTKIHTQIKNSDVLRKTLLELGEVILDSRHEVSGYNSQKVKAEIVCHGGKIGFALNKEGVYEIMSDWYVIHDLNKKQFTEDVQQTYAKNIVMDGMRKKGYQVVSNTVNEEQEICLTMRAW